MLPNAERETVTETELYSCQYFDTNPATDDKHTQVAAGINFYVKKDQTM